MARRYYLSMLSLALVVLALGIVSMWLAGHLERFTGMLLGVGLVLVVMNLIGAHVLFAPVGRYLAGQTDLHKAQRRLRRLPQLSAAWAFILMMGLMYPQYYFHHVGHVSHAADLLHVLVYPLTLIALFAAFMALYAYFLVGDCTTYLRESLFQRQGIVIEPAGGRMLHRLLAAFVATSLLPLLLFFVRSFLLADMRPLQDLEDTQMLQLNMISAGFLAAIAIVFISRSLTRPLSTLLASMRQVGRGDLRARAPVVSDDEVGALALGFNAMAEGLQERAFVRDTLGKFVPESIAAAVLKDKGIVRPQVREATVLFTDIERFTAIAEGLSPEQVIAMLNEYFAAAAGPIHEHGGVITQFQGDAILASFNLPLDDPDHAANAVRAALGIQRALAGRGFGKGVALHTRIGINSGSVVGGTVGDGDRLGYTVHGDAVNLAARLEQLNKRYGSRVLVARRTVELAGGNFDFRRIGEVAIPGHAAPVTVYELKL